MSMPFLQAPSHDRLWLPQAGEKSFNDLWIKSNSFCHLREYFCESPSSKMSRYGIMATQLLAMLTTIHHLLKREIVVYLVNLRHLLHSTPLDVCFMSQLERCFNDSPRELILWSLRWSVHVDMFRSLSSCWLKFLKQDDKTKMVANQRSYKVQPGSWRLC